MFFDWTYILALAGLLLTMAAQAGVSSAFSRYNKVRSISGLTGETAAAAVLRALRVNGVTISHVEGSLTDHYDPRTSTLRLSDSTYRSPSVAAICVAAHECGHAQQHQKHYAPLQLRSTLVPAANFGSQAAWPVFLAGMFFSLRPLMTAGIVLFSLAVLFQLITLPVEFDASARAMKVLKSEQLIPADELDGARVVLRAAALTYVAALASSLLQLLRLVLLAGRRRRD